ncbi:MAG: DUF4384 domain-containing protein [Gemmatimonadaceae bacterium]
MISAIFPILFSVVTTAAPAPAPAATTADPAIRVTLNHDSYNRGDRARVTVRVRDDGYVVVLHTDANGRVRVLFPVDPGDDNFMKAGQDYEIRGRGDRDAFQVTSTGSGTVYAAVSMDAFHPDAFTRNNHWDYTRLESDSASSDNAEASMTSIVDQMADGSHFDYDLATYTVEGSYASSQRAYIVPTSTYSCFYGGWDPWCDGYYPSPSYFGVGIGFGFGGLFGRPYYGGGYYGGGYYGGGYYGGGYYPRGYGSTGYGYSLGHGFTYRNRPVVLGAGGGYIGGSRAGFGLGSTVGYRNRGASVSSHTGASPLYGVSRFNTQRSPSRGNDSPYARRTASGDQAGFRTRVGGDRPSYDNGGSRVSGRVDGGPARVERAPLRVEREPSRGGNSSPMRVEPRSEPRSQPRSEPRSEGRSRSPERSSGGGSHESHQQGGGGGGGGGGGRRGGGGGGHRP